MKKKIGMMVLGGGAAAVVLVAMSAGGAGISGTAHDLSGLGTDQICIFCHTPHNAKTGADNLAPLWNHKVTTTATFTVYPSGGTMNATPGQPSATSKACLSCHDGAVAIDAYGTSSGTTNMTGAALIGTDLSNDHPISFTYDGTLATADGGLVTPSSSSKVDAGGLVPLFSGKMECGSCHNVHSDDNQPFLRKSNSGSALCLTCHNK